MPVLGYLIIGIFAALLFINLYFRFKVLGTYRILIKNKIEFGHRHIFDSTLLQKEILPKYPTFAKEIQSFTKNIKVSIGIAIILVLLITIMGVILNY